MPHENWAAIAHPILSSQSWVRSVYCFNASNMLHSMRFKKVSIKCSDTSVATEKKHFLEKFNEADSSLIFDVQTFLARWCKNLILDIAMCGNVFFHIPAQQIGIAFETYFKTWCIYISNCQKIFVKLPLTRLKGLL